MKVLTRLSSEKDFKSCVIEGDNIQKKLLNTLVTVEDELGDFRNILFYQIPDIRIRKPLRVHNTNTFREIAELVKTKVFDRFYFVKYESVEAVENDIDSMRKFVNRNY